MEDYGYGGEGRKVKLVDKKFYNGTCARAAFRLQGCTAGHDHAGFGDLCDKTEW